MQNIFSEKTICKGQVYKEVYKEMFYTDLLCSKMSQLFIGGSYYFYFVLSRMFCIILKDDYLKYCYVYYILERENKSFRLFKILLY